MAKSVKVSTIVSAPVGEAIECLLWQGLHGSTRSEVVRRLIEQAVELQIVRGHLRHDQLTEPAKRPEPARQDFGSAR